MVKCGTQCRVITAVVLLASYGYFIVDATVVFIGFFEALKKKKKVSHVIFSMRAEMASVFIGSSGRESQTDGLTTYKMLFFLLVLIFWLGLCVSRSERNPAA